MPLRAFRFDSIVIRPAVHELWAVGQRQPVSPKVLHLLVFLLQHRCRVVTKRELAAVLCPGRSIGDAVIARLVMQARRVIGDPASQPVRIRTVHGLGYRFCGQLEEVEDAEVQLVQPALLPAAASTVTFMPFDLQCSGQALGWLSTGLPALAALAARCQLTVDVRLPAPLDRMERRPADAGPSTPAQHAIHGVVRSHGAAFHLDYRIQTLEGGGSVGSLRAQDPTVLARELCKAVATAVSSDKCGTARLVSEDAFTNEAFGRALAELAAGRPEAAAGMLEAVCALEPDSVPMLEWRRRARAACWRVPMIDVNGTHHAAPICALVAGASSQRSPSSRATWLPDANVGRPLMVPQRSAA